MLKMQKLQIIQKTPKSPNTPNIPKNVKSDTIPKQLFDLIQQSRIHLKRHSA
jgi:hypothetical protein